jgi:hypothetical protein
MITRAIDAGDGRITREARKEEAIPSFQKAVSLIEAGKLENKDRSEMLRRLALGHINELTVGDWNLEKEIWQRIE